MSLQVWLPFTDGTLKQQGVKNVSATAVGTVDLTDNGKLGKCVTFNGGGGITLPPSTMTSFTECSVVFWINITAWNTNWDTIFQAGLNSAPWNHYIFGILRNQGNYLCFTVSNGSNSTQGGYASSNLTVGEWIHLAFTYGNGKCKIYINGILDKEYSASITPKFTDITNIAIGRGTNGSSYQSKCKLNDFRIYDHCLSPMEVKQISQGLVLHYPLDNNGVGGENLLTKTVSEFVNWTNINSDCVTVTSDNYKNVFLLTQGVGGKWENVYSPAITVEANKEYTISCLYKVYDNYNFTTAYGDFGLTVMKAVPTNANPISNTIARASFKNVAGGFWKAEATFTPTVTTIYLNMCGGSIVDGQTNKKFDVNYIKLEEGSIATPWCPNKNDALYSSMGMNDGIEYDTSGFGNNGTRVGEFSWSSDTPRYLSSTKLETEDVSVRHYINNSSFIRGDINLVTPDRLTIAFWANINSYGSGGNGVVVTSNISLLIPDDYNRTALHHYDAKLNSYSSDGVSLNVVSPFIQNEWHHYTFVYNGKDWLTYRDADLKNTNSFSEAKKLATFGWIYFGYSQAGGVGRANDGYYSDVRVYATALSAEDIQKLYSVSALIDSQGNTFASSYVEG